MKVYLEANRYGHYEIWKVDGKEDDREADLYVQTDWDFPSTAMMFGWIPCCGSGRTDGTVDCPDCGRTASKMIGDAADYLDGCAGISEIPDDCADYFPEAE